MLNQKIICHPVPEEIMHPKTVIGDDTTNAHMVLRSSENEQLLYLDGACGSEPIFIGITKSRGSQENKLPVCSGDMLGGLQVYARTVPGNSLGYDHNQTPLTSAIQFRVDNNYNGENIVPSEMLIGLTDNEGMSVKLVLDSKGNLSVSKSITFGELTVTDVEVPASNIDPQSEKHILVKFAGEDYAMVLKKIVK